MRVVATMQYRNLLDDLAQQKERMDIAQRQISTGLRVFDLKEDPLAAGEISNLEAQEALVDRFIHTADNAVAKLNYTDAVFSQLLNIVTSAMTTGAAALNLNSDPASRQALADRVAALREEVLANANAKHQGSYIFSGTATLTQPYPTSASAYQGDPNAIYVRADETTVVQTNIPGDQVFQGTDPLNVFEYFTDLQADILANDTVGINQNIQALQGVFDRMNALHTVVGNATSQVNMIKERLGSGKLENQTLQSKLGSANLAEAITDMTLAQTGLEATLQSGAQIAKLSLIDFLS